MNKKRMWVKILGYTYKKDERVRFVKRFKDDLYPEKFPRGYVCRVDEDLGETVRIEEPSRTFTIVFKEYVEPFPFIEYKIGDKVKSLVEVVCSGTCTSLKNRMAYSAIRKGRIGEIVLIQRFSIYHLLYNVKFRSNDTAWYEDYEVKRIDKKKK